MKKTIGIYGTTHLALTISASFLKKNFEVILFDKNFISLKKIQKLEMPIYEPNMYNVFSTAIKNKKIKFSFYPKSDLKKIDILYFAEDSIKTKEGVDLNKLKKSIYFVSKNKNEKFIFIISSQIPVGTCEVIKKTLNSKRKNNIDFVYIPEFLRLGNAIELYMNQDYIIIGNDNKKIFNKLTKILGIFSKKIFSMSLSEAEFSKHFANIYVASSVSLVSQFSQLANNMNINLTNVGLALRNDKRIGPKSYILPGLGFTGGNIERDLKVVSKMIRAKFNRIPIMLDAILKVNTHHNLTPINIIYSKFKNLKNKKISFLGVTYKENTNTLRGSLTMMYAKKLIQKGAKVKIYDADLKLDYKIDKIEVCNTVDKCLHNSDVLIIVIAKKEYKNLSPKKCKKLMSNKYIIDAANMLSAKKFINEGFSYSGIGTGYSA